MKYTKEEVHKILLANNRHSKRINNEYSIVSEIEFLTPIQDWIDDYDLVPIDKLGRIYADYFEIDYDEKEWKQVVEPPSKKTVGDFCGYIASKAEKYDSADAFLQIKRQVEEKSKNKISEESIVSEGLEKHYSNLILEINKLNPAVDILLKFKKNKVLPSGINILIASIILQILVFFFGSKNFSPILMIGMFLGLILVIYGKFIHKNKVEIVGIKTYADLISLIQKTEN